MVDSAGEWFYTPEFPVEFVQDKVVSAREAAVVAPTHLVSVEVVVAVFFFIARGSLLFFPSVSHSKPSTQRNFCMRS